MPWTADALSPRAAAAMAAHAGACPRCAALAERERAFDRRVAAALETRGARREVDELLAQARVRGRRRPLRVHAARAAAVLVACSTGAWFLCLPPFECAYVSAIEEAAGAALRGAAAEVPRAETDAAVLNAAEALARIVQPPAEIAGRAIHGAAEPCVVREFGWTFPAVRAAYGEGAGSAVVVWCDSRAQHPSFRRARELDGVSWWTNGADHPTYAAFRCDRTGIVCSVVSPGGAALDVARAIRGR